MLTKTLVAALALTIGAATASLADTRQLAASAGVDAFGLSLTEIARAKINAEARGDDRVPMVTPGSSGPGARSQLIAAAGLTQAEAAGMSLTELAAAKSFREDRGDDRHVYVASSDANGGAGVSQLAASTGIAPEVARTMSIHEIYLEKIVRESSDD